MLAVMALVVGMLAYWGMTKAERLVANARAWKEQGNPDAPPDKWPSAMVSFATAAAILLFGCSLE